MSRTEIEMLAVALGTDLATVRQRLDAAFPLPPAPAAGADLGGGVMVDPHSGRARRFRVLADGSHQEVA